MISEKTVELNLTTELVNWASWATGSVHFALAPSQRQEGQLGFDTSVQANGTGLLIQYKRAYVNGSHWLGHLNRTTRQAQHLRLQILEGSGIPVFYAFPFFHTPHEVESRRRRLLLSTFWYRPSRINPPGGSTGHHDVHYESSTGRWWVTSEQEVDLPPPDNTGALLDVLEEERNKNNLKRLFESFNKAMTKELDEEVGQRTKSEEEQPDLMHGVSAFIQV